MVYDPIRDDPALTAVTPGPSPSSSYDPMRDDPTLGGDSGTQSGPPPAPPSLLSRTWGTLADAASSIGSAASYTGPRLGAGVVQGVHDVIDKPATWLADAAGELGLADDNAGDKVRQQNQQTRQQFEKDYGDSTIASAGRVIGQTAATAPLLATGGGAVTGAVSRFAPRLAPVVDYLGGTGGAGLFGRAGSLASQGAIQGGATGALTAQPGQEGSDALKGAAMGAVLGPAVQAAFTPVRAALGTLPGAVGQDIANWADKAKTQYGIDVDPAMLPTNPTYRIIADQSGKIPFSGAQAADQARRLGWQQAVANQFGEQAPNGITYDVMDRAATRIGQDFDNVANRTTINGATIPGDMAQISQDMNRWGLTQDQVTRVGAQARNVLDAFRTGNGQITGQTYQNLTQRGGPLETLVSSTDPSLASFGMRIRGALDNAFQNSASPQDQALLTQARSQYRAMKTVEPLVEQRGATGDINPTGLLQQVRAQSARFDPSTGGLAYTGGGPMGDLANIGSIFFQRAPESGTAARAAVMGALAGGSGVAGMLYPPALAGTAATLAANRAAQAWLRSPTVGRRMVQTALSGQGPRGLGNVAIPGLLGALNQ